MNTRADNLSIIADAVFRHAITAAEFCEEFAEFRAAYAAEVPGEVAMAAEAVRGRDLEPFELAAELYRLANLADQIC